MNMIGCLDTPTSGKYYIDTITHNVSGSGGYTMDLEMSLVEE